MKNVRHVADILETAGRRDSRERPAATRRVWCRQPGVYFSPCDSNHDGGAGVPRSIRPDLDAGECVRSGRRTTHPEYRAARNPSYETAPR